MFFLIDQTLVAQVFLSFRCTCVSASARQSRARCCREREFRGEIMLDRVCVEERTEPPVCPAAASLGQKVGPRVLRSSLAGPEHRAREVDASMSPIRRSALALRR